MTRYTATIVAISRGETGAFVMTGGTGALVDVWKPNETHCHAAAAAAAEAPAEAAAAAASTRAIHS